MSRRAVFVDVDGTLVDETGRVPASAAAAVRTARANGHLVFLCTGRSRAELWPDLLAIGFDGTIGAAGAFVEVGGRVLVHEGVPDASVRRAVTFFDALGVHVYLQADEAVYARPQVRRWLQQALFTGVDTEQVAAMRTGPFGFVDRIRTELDLAGTTFTKVIYLACPVPLAELRVEFAGEFDIAPSSVVAFGPGCGEMMIPDVHKATGLDRVLEHVGLDRSATIAIGDSFNDVEVLQHAGVGIAMGNAPDAVKAVADEVTASVDADGLAAAFHRHGLLVEGLG